jgi:pilus assembly protein Flp/PilA
VKAFARNESGATAIEYALIATLISIVIVSSLTLIGSKVKAMFASIVF